MSWRVTKWPSEVRICNPQGTCVLKLSPQAAAEVFEGMRDIFGGTEDARAELAYVLGEKAKPAPKPWWRRLLWFLPLAGLLACKPTGSRPTSHELAYGVHAIDDADAGVRCYVAAAGATVGGVPIHCVKVTP